jgi:hypothetical protein
MTVPVRQPGMRLCAGQPLRESVPESSDDPWLCRVCEQSVSSRRPHRDHPQSFLESVLKLCWSPRSCVPVALGRRCGSLRRVGGLDLATVAAANDAWVLAPEGSEVVETAEYRLVRFPERFADPLQVQWVRSARPAEAVLGEVVARAVGFGLPEAYVYVKLSAPDGFDEALLGVWRPAGRHLRRARHGIAGRRQGARSPSA